VVELGCSVTNSFSVWFLYAAAFYAKAGDDFKRDAAAKLEAFIASKTSAENASTTSTTWVN
jgi:hypothetical protein